MKSKLIVSLALLFATLSLSKAQTSTIVQWTFENLAITNYSPNPLPSIDNSKGAEFVQALGMTNYPTTGFGTNDPDVLQGAGGDSSAVGAPGSSNGGDGITNTSEEWRVRATGAGNGWSSQAAVGTQGAQFSVDTTGYTNIQVAFDWYLTKQGEANIQLQYSDDNTNWTNIPITVPAAQSGYLLISNNTTLIDPNSVQGYFAQSVTNKGGQEWYTNLTAIITDPLAANNPHFGIRMVNASTGSSCISGTGAALNNSSGNWRFDNININGTSLPGPIVEWTFDNLPVAINLDPAPSLNNSLGAVSAAAIGMELFGSGTTNDPDVTAGAPGDNGSDGITNYSLIWRVRGAPGNGWTSAAGIGTQGAEFAVDTTGYTNVTVGFDWYLTTQGEGNLQLQYTDDGINWLNIAITVPAAELGTWIGTNDNTSGLDPNSEQGYYVTNIPSALHQEWFTNLTAIISDPAAANNSHFAFRMVNASTGSSCVNSEGGALNNSSGNWRFDNIIVSAVNSGVTLLTPPTITASATATVDGPFTNTFTDNPNWRTNIFSVKVGGVTLASSAYVISAGQIVYTPSASTLLQKAGTVNISFASPGYGLDLVSQPISAGAGTKLTVSSQPVGPTGDGGTLVSQPTLKVFDQYGNLSAGGTATYTATANGAWNFGFGSSTVQTLANGVCNFTNLSAVSGGAVSGATITFTASGLSGLTGLPYTTTNTAGFNIPAPATAGFTPGNIVVEQLDANSANTTFSMLELNPLIANQAVPVNTFPVPATYTNGLRNSNSGSTGRLANSQDGTMVLFTAGLLSDSTVGDSTTWDLRGCGSFNSYGNFTLQTTYTGLGDATANQARSATTIDDITYWMGDKGGVYTNGENPNDAYIAYTVGNEANVRSLKAYNGTVYALQQEGGSDPQASVMATVTPPSSGVAELQELQGFPIDGSVLDFAAVASGANGTNIDTIYYIDGTNATSGSIFKFTNSFAISGVTGDQIWANTGGSQGYNVQTANGGDGLAVRTNPNGGFDLFYTTGSGATVGNQVVMLHDAAAWSQPINFTATNVLYNALPGTILKGVAFAPTTVTNGIVIYPIGKLGNTSYSFTGANKGFSLSFNSGVNGSGSFTLWGTTNLLTPRSQWINLGHPTEAPPGTYTFTDASAVTNPQTFYQVTSP